MILCGGTSTAAGRFGCERRDFEVGALDAAGAVGMSSAIALALVSVVLSLETPSLPALRALDPCASCDGLRMKDEAEESMHRSVSEFKA